MNLKAMKMFLSEENVKKHLEHFRNLRLRFSVLEKSIPELKGKDISAVSKLSISRKIKDEALELLWQIKSHELFFNSFTINPLWNEEIRKHNSSRERLIYDVFSQVKDLYYGFLYVYTDRHKNIITIYSNKYDGTFVKYQPSLCLDLYEHTYFNDYGFKKDKFLSNALGYFDTGRL